MWILTVICDVYGKMRYISKRWRKISGTFVPEIWRNVYKYSFFMENNLTLEIERQRFFHCNIYVTFHRKRSTFQNVWRQSSGTKCTWTLTSNVLKSTPFPMEPKTISACGNSFLNSPREMFWLLCESFKHMMVKPSLCSHQPNFNQKCASRIVAIKVQVHFVSELWRQRFEKYLFPVERHKYHFLDRRFWNAVENMNWCHYLIYYVLQTCWLSFVY